MCLECVTFKNLRGFIKKPTNVQATLDNIDVEWVYVAQGTYEKTTGGSVAKLKLAKD